MGMRFTAKPKAIIVSEHGKLHRKNAKKAPSTPYRRSAIANTSLVEAGPGKQLDMEKRSAKVDSSSHFLRSTNSLLRIRIWTLFDVHQRFSKEVKQCQTLGRQTRSSLTSKTPRTPLPAWRATAQAASREASYDKVLAGKPIVMQPKQHDSQSEFDDVWLSAPVVKPRRREGSYLCCRCIWSQSANQNITWLTPQRAITGLV